MSWWDNGKSNRHIEKSSNQSFEDFVMNLEMCDVCGKSYHRSYIRRIPFRSHDGINYVLRCCPYCDPNVKIRELF